MAYGLGGQALTFRINMLLLSSGQAVRLEVGCSRFILIASTHIPKYTAPRRETDRLENLKS